MSTKSQTIYIADKSTALRAIDKAEEKYYTGLTFGNTTPNELRELINELYSSSDFVHVSKIAQKIRNLETYKAISRANFALDMIIKEINKNRQVL